MVLLVPRRTLQSRGPRYIRRPQGGGACTGGQRQQRLNGCWLCRMGARKRDV